MRHFYDIGYLMIRGYSSRYCDHRKFEHVPYETGDICKKCDTIYNEAVESIVEKARLERLPKLK